MEKNILAFYDMGLVTAEELVCAQKAAHSHYKGLLIAAQLPAQIDFGTSREKNKFSKEVQAELIQKYGPLYNAKGEFRDTVKEKLMQDGYKGIPITFNERGGGATVTSEGQQMYFFAGDMSHVANDYYQFTHKATHGIGDAMIESAAHFLGRDNIVRAPSHSTTIKAENYDVGYQGEDKIYKLGSKGMKTKSIEGKNYIYFGGFCIHHTPQSIKYASIVDPCGIPLEEVGATSLEELYGTKIPHSELNRVVTHNVSKIFGYGGVKEIKSIKGYHN